MRVVALISGGLDSLLAYHWCKRRGHEVFPIHFLSPFSKPSILKFENIKHVNFGGELIELVKRPGHGYGRNLNPCIDCHILMLKKAKDYMVEIGADFIVTGEVLSQRPMSQFRNTLLVIEKEAGLSNMVLRPLSGKLLPETEMEKKGWVDRKQLFDIQGRSRKVQLNLAKEWGLTDFFSPAGGCLLTDKNFCVRLKEELVHNQNITIRDIELLKVGRHFWLDDLTKLIVGRNERENKILEDLAQKGEVLLEVLNFGSPVALLTGSKRYLTEAAAVVKKYSDGKNESQVRVVWRIKDEIRKEVDEILI